MEYVRVCFTLVFAVYFLQENVCCDFVETSTVRAKSGTFVGYIYRSKSYGHELVSKRFLGIPYAESPVGSLRFEKPRPKVKLTEPFEAQMYGPSCMQQTVDLGGVRKPGRLDNLQMSEDCLFLNIFTPYDDNESLQLRPVMIFIHGGGFVIGTPIMYPGDYLSTTGSVVVVTIAYRLSIWGFLSTGDTTLPGNNGLWDQHMAIKWVYDNIEAFGGNPNMITLFGSSAGGASVIYQSMFPANKGLIQRAIPQSGSITCPWAYNSNPLKAARRLAKLVNCDTGQTTINELVKCLKSMSTGELQKALDAKENRFIRFPMEFVTTVDGEFIPEPPNDLFHGTSETSHLYRETLSGLDLMTGVTSNEGLMMLIPFVGVDDVDEFKADLERFEQELVPDIVNIVFGKDVPDIVRLLLIHEYTNFSDPYDTLNSLKSYIDLSSDYVFNIQAVETALVHARISDKNTYMYLYDAFPIQRLLAAPSWANKPQHLDDLTTLLGDDHVDGFTSWAIPYTEEASPKWQAHLSKAHVAMWTNFAKSGNPNEPIDVKHHINTEWQTFDTNSQKYLCLSRQMTHNSVNQRPFAQATNFWWNLLPEFINSVRREHMTLASGAQESCPSDGDC